MQNDPILHAAANTAEDFAGGITGMAAAIGKPKFSLMHELSGHGSAKLGLKDAAKMVRRAGDPRILNAFATECGYQPPLPLPELLELQGSDTMRDLARVAKEFSDVIREVSERLEDDDVSENDLEAIQREWSELVAAGQRMVVQLRAKHEAAKPSHLRAA